MTAAALLAELRRLGFRLRLARSRGPDGRPAVRLMVSPPGGGPMHPDDAAVIAAARDELLQALDWETWPPDPAAD